MRASIAAAALAMPVILAGCGSDEVNTATDRAVETTGAPTTSAPTNDAGGASPEGEVIEEDGAQPDETGPMIVASFAGLEPLGEGFVYEGWAIIDGEAESSGRFTVEANGARTEHSPSLVDDPAAASRFVLTIEPAVGDEPAPTEARILAGDLVDGEAELTVAHADALGSDFEDAGGELVLATPTSASTDDELSGIWFIRLGPTRPGLDLPALPSGWIYEGWAIIDGRPVTTGRFADPAEPDDFAGFSGSDATGPPLPGEDLIQNAPSGLEFPVDLTGSTVVISIEPVHDDSPEPFGLTPLSVVIPDGIGDHEPIVFAPGPAFPTGTATVEPDEG